MEYLAACSVRFRRRTPIEVAVYNYGPLFDGWSVRYDFRPAEGGESERGIRSSTGDVKSGN